MTPARILTLSPSTTAHIDLTASLPSLQASLTPGAPGYVQARNRLALRSAEEFSLASIRLMACWLFGFVAFLTVAILIWR